MNPTHLIIFNRATAGIEAEWIHIVPKGELPNREAGVVQVLDDAALTRILANIEADKAKLGDRWPGIYAGREHFIYNAEQDSAALAWFKEFQARPDGLWAKADGLTPAGQAALRNKEYKFTSFVADRRDTQDLGNNRLRILKLETIGFTNQANGKELLTPITNRAEQSPATASAAADSQQQPTTKTHSMKNIASRLKLSADASEDAICEQLDKLTNRLATLEPLATENSTLKNRNTELEAEGIAALLDAYGVKEEGKRTKLAPVLATLKNRDERVAFLTDILPAPAPAKDAKKDDQGRMLNRSGAQLPGAKGGTNATEDEPADRFKRLMNRHVTEGKLTKSAALQLAITEDNEAYTEWLKAGAGKL